MIKNAYTNIRTIFTVIKINGFFFLISFYAHAIRYFWRPCDGLNSTRLAYLVTRTDRNVDDTKTAGGKNSVIVLETEQTKKRNVPLTRYENYGARRIRRTLVGTPVTWPLSDDGKQTRWNASRTRFRRYETRRGPRALYVIDGGAPASGRKSPLVRPFRFGCASAANNNNEKNNRRRKSAVTDIRSGDASPALDGPHYNDRRFPPTPVRR